MDVELTIDDVQVTAAGGRECARRRAPRRRGHPGAVPPRGRAGHRLLPPVPHGGAPAGPRLGAADDLVRLPGVGRPRRRDGLAAHPQAPGHEPAAAAAARPGRAGAQAARRAARRDGAAVRPRHRRAAPRLHPVRALRARVLRPGLQRAGGHRPRRPQAHRPALRAGGGHGLRRLRVLRRRRAPPRASRWRTRPPTRTIWGRTFDLLACERCDRPITTQALAAAMAAGKELPAKSGELCDACKRRVLSEQLASPGR